MSQNEIKKQVHLKFPKTQVWKALAESNRFGSWFRMKLEGRFVQGEEIRGSIQPTTVDSDVAKMQKPHAGNLVQLQKYLLPLHHELNAAIRAAALGVGVVRDGAGFAVADGRDLRRDNDLLLDEIVFHGLCAPL